MLFALSACGGVGGDDGDGAGGTNTPVEYEARVFLGGPLANASVEVYTYSGIDAAAIHNTTTTDGDMIDGGFFAIPVDDLGTDDLFLIKVSGGSDLDIDQDGVLDASPAANLGSLYAFATHNELAGNDVSVTLVSTALYYRMRYLAAANEAEADFLSRLNQLAARLLLEDLGTDFKVDNADVLSWQPQPHPAAPYRVADYPALMTDSTSASTAISANPFTIRHSPLCR